MEVNNKNATDALSKVIEPELHKDLITLDMIKKLTVNGKNISFTVMLTTPACPLKSVIEKECKLQILKHFQEELNITVNFDSEVKSDHCISGAIQLPIKNIIAVGSGKGGVGKSTVSVNLAVSLAATGAKVGLLDADLYGPNLPMMMGIDKLPPYKKDILVPAKKHSVLLISLGFLVPTDEAVVWRGPMLHSTLRNL